MTHYNLADSQVMPFPGTVSDTADEVEWENEIAGGRTTYDLFRTLRRFAASHGFETFIVVVEPSKAGARLADIALINNWKPELLRSCDRLSLLETLPGVDWIRNSVEPLHWTLELIGEHAGAEARQLFESYHVRAGVQIGRAHV